MPIPRPPRTRHLVAVALLGALAAGGLAACSDDGGGASADALARRLPADGRDLLVVDLDAGRKAYDLPADAEPDFKGGFRGFAALASAAVPAAAQSDPRVLQALDQGAIHAVATSAVPDQVTLVRTSQPWDEMAGKLAKAGWTRRGDELSRGNGAVVVRDGDVWIWARTRAAAKAAMTERDGAVQGLADAASGIDGAVIVGFASDRPACTTGVVLSQVPKTLDGQAVVLLDRRAQASWGPIVPGSPWFLKDKRAGDGKLTARYHLT